MIHKIRMSLFTTMVAVGAGAGSLSCAHLSSLQARVAGKQQLEGHIRPDFAQAPLVGTLDDKTHLDLAIGLQLRNRSQFDALVQEIADPASQHYRKYLTADQFAEGFGPTEHDYQALIAYARSKGLAVTDTYSNRVVLDVAGTASAIQNAFHAKLITRRRPDGSIFYAPEREPSLDLDVPILHITGLDNYDRPKPAPGSGTNGEFVGSDFRNAYAPGTALTGAGESVGLFELDGFFTAGPNAYEAKFNLHVPVQVVTLNGFSQNSSESGPNGAPSGGLDAEVALDVEMPMAMAPGLQSVIVYEGNNADSVIEAMVSPQGGNPPSSQLSASWTGWHASSTTIMLFEIMQGVQGQTFFVCAGDGRAICFPSELGDDRALDFVTVVGGTLLSMNGSGASWQSETAASAGGGIEVGTPIPSYQVGVANFANGGSSIYRNIPDVAIVYDNILYNDNGQEGSIGGTSAGTPLWAGFMALVNQQAKLSGLPPVGFINQIIYTIGSIPPLYARDFNDITSGGSQSSPGCPGFNAVPGYDLVTGWGTPKAALINDLINPPVTRSSKPDPQCALLSSEIQRVQGQVNEYTTKLQSAGGSAEKQDIQRGLNDATAELNSLRSQYVSLGCTEPTPKVPH